MSTDTPASGGLDARTALAAPHGRMPYEAVIGLEIHAQLLTTTKIFCGCETAFGAKPNTHVCPVCLGFPGALPVLNQRAVEYAIRAALALGCTVEPTSVFARKNYFYPDLPKGYQISQYDRPLATGGLLEWQDGDRTVRVGITRIHMEEDAGKSLHEGFGDSSISSYIDLNRAGVPLIEIVSEPDVRSATDAAQFFTRLRAILVALGINDGNMEEGSLRCDANVSVRPWGTTAFGTKTEVKNVNSFRYLEKAIDYEIHRHCDLLMRGERIVQETRLFDSASGHTFSLRSKEDAHDYRYFPEPDLPPLTIASAWVDDIARTLPELPEARRARFIGEYGLPPYDAAWLTQSMEMATYFEEVARATGNAKASSNWIMGELARLMKDRSHDIAQVPVTSASLARLIALIDEGRISGSIAKGVLEKMYSDGRPPDVIVEQEGLARIDDEGAVLAAVASVLAANADAAADYRAGKAKSFGFLVGQVMKASGGKANPALVNAVLKRELGG